MNDNDPPCSCKIIIWKFFWLIWFLNLSGHVLCSVANLEKKAYNLLPIIQSALSNLYVTILYIIWKQQLFCSEWMNVSGKLQLFHQCLKLFCNHIRNKSMMQNKVYILYLLRHNNLFFATTILGIVSSEGNGMSNVYSYR